jgi:manganese/zinc/iron transport system substrate-binding protein
MGENQQKMKTLKLIFLLSALSAVAWMGCSSAEKQSKESCGIKVTTTTTMITDLARQVGGDLVEVQGLMGPGVDPHLHQPSDEDIDKLKGADVIFYHGLHLEGQMSKMFEKFEGSKKHVYRVTKPIPADRLLSPKEFKGLADPHIWFEVPLWALCVEEVVKGLSAADPANAATYQQNGERVRSDMNELHEWALQRVGELPVEKRILFTSHDAFNYFARGYGFKVEALLGISTDDKAGNADVTKMVDLIKASSVKVLFTESSVSSKGLEQIKRDAGARIGGVLFSDAMGQPGKLEGPRGAQYDVGTYEGMIRHNINTIVDAIK